MGYNKLKVLLLAAQEAHKEGSLLDYQYSKILEDIDSNLVDVDSVILQEDVKSIILQYSSLT